MNTRLFSVFAVILVLLSVVAYWLMTRDGMDMDMDMDMAGMAAPAAVDSNSRKPLYWVAPMDANYRRDVSGLSPMGMPLIPVYESSDTITVSPAIQQNLGLRTDVVVREDFAPNIASCMPAPRVGWRYSTWPARATPSLPAMCSTNCSRLRW